MNKVAEAASRITQKSGRYRQVPLWRRLFVPFLAWLASAALAGLFAIGCSLGPVFSITPTEATIQVGQTQQFVGLENGRRVTAAWVSSDPTIATVDNTGLTTGLKVGNVTIRATADSLPSAATLHVVGAGVTLTSIAVTPATPTIVAGFTQQFTATGTYSDGSTNDVTNEATWMSGTPAAATIAASGLATGVATGSSLITATDGTVSGSTTLTVTPPTLTLVSASPASASVQVGQTKTYTLTAHYSNGTTTNPTTGVTWTSSNTTVASITNVGVATALAVGTTNINGSFGGLTSQNVATLTVTALPTLQSIAVSPTTASIQVGQSQAYTATGTYSDASTKDLTAQATWASSSTGVASINASGVATALAAGSTNITATLAGITNTTTATLTVTAVPTLQSIAVTPATASVQVGQTQAYTATGTYSDASTKNLTSQVTWTSATTAVATINSSGVASALTTGTTLVSAALGGITSPSVTLTVTPSTQQGTVPRYYFGLGSDNTISTYAVIPTTGQMRPITYFETGSPGLPAFSGGALNPVLPVLYVIEPVSLTALLVTYSIGSDGVLQQLGSQPLTSGTQISQLVVDPQGRYLWGATSNHGPIVSFPLNSTTGAPGAQINATTLTTLVGIAADPTGTYIFGTASTGDIHSFSVGSGGSLTEIGTPPTTHPQAAATGSLSVTPSGKFLYVIDDSSQNTIFAYSISGTGLTLISGSPFNIPNVGGFVTQIAIDPSSAFLYLIDTADQSQPLDAFSIGASGTLTGVTLTATIPSGASPKDLVADPSGQFVYVYYSNINEIWTYSITPTGASAGNLTLANRVRSRTSFNNNQLLSAGSTAVSFTPKALYVANNGSNSLAQLSINASTGGLTSLAAPLGTGTGPMGVAADPLDRFVYITNNTTNNLSGYSIAAGGVLSSLSGSPFNTGNGPSGIVVDPSSRFLFESDTTDHTLTGFTIPSSGALQVLAGVASTDNGPSSVAIDPTGQFVYTANSSGTVDAFKINPSSGALTIPTGSSIGAGSQTSSLAVHPSGRFVYATTLVAGTLPSVDEFSVNATTGVLTSLMPTVTVNNLSGVPGPIAIEPTGKYLYTPDGVNGTIVIYAVSPITGLLTAAGTPLNVGFAARALTIDISGQYLYVCNPAGSVSTYKISLSDGSLTTVGSAVSTAGTSPGAMAATGTVQ